GRRLDGRRCGSTTRRKRATFPKVPLDHFNVGPGLLLKLPPLSAVVLMEEQKQNRSEERLINEDQEPMEHPGGIVPLDEQDHEDKDDIENNEHDEDEEEGEVHKRPEIRQAPPPRPGCHREPTIGIQDLAGA